MGWKIWLVLFFAACCGALVAHAKISQRVESFYGDDICRSASVWIFFVDKGLLNEDKRRDIHETTLRQLDAGAARRRLKMEARYGSPLVDLTDAPVSCSYIRAVEIAASTGGFSYKIRTISKWLNAISIQVECLFQIKEIARLPFVQEVEVVDSFRQVKATDTVPLPLPKLNSKRMMHAMDYGDSLAQLALMQVPTLHEMGLTGANVTIAVFDSGFNINHPAIVKENILATFDFVKNDSSVGVDKNDRLDIVNHGTMALSNIAAKAPGKMFGPAFDAKLLLARTEDIEAEHQGEEDFFVAALEWAERLGADIVSASLGYSDWITWDQLDGETTITSRGIKLAVERGLLVIVANGNSGNRIGTPADAKDIIAVGAVDVHGSLASFSARGPTSDGRIKPEVCAPGKSVVVALASGGYGLSSGTSFATPHTAGVAALLLQAHPEWTNLELRDAIISTASRSATPSVDFGWGIVQAAAALNYVPVACENSCRNGVCSPSGACECKSGFYNLKCNQGPIPCRNWCRYTCTVDNQCVCSGITNSRCFSDLTLPAWTCEERLFNAGDGVCNCNCTRYDPDCDSDSIVFGCDGEDDSCFHYQLNSVCVKKKSSAPGKSVSSIVALLFVMLVQLVNINAL